MDDLEGTVTRNEKIAKGYYALDVVFDKPFGPPVPGQFVMVMVPGEGVYLRRPFSIYGYGEKTLALLYRVAGKGTEALSLLGRGDRLMVLGPLGKGFRVGRDTYPIIVGGGIGIAGVRTLIDSPGKECAVLFGCSGVTETALVDDLAGINLSVATLDGSAGFHGTVIELLEKRLPALSGKNITIYACGPDGMISSLRGLLENERIPCQVLLEERMACGLGLCFGCVKKTTDENEPYKRVCKEGPVFDLWELSQ